MHPDDTARCFRAHLGLYAIEPIWFAQAVQAIQAGLWPLAPLQAWREADATPQGATPDRERLFTPLPNGVALIRIVGGITKGWSKFGGASTIGITRALRQALVDAEVSSILLAVDSPGGQVAGVQEAADAIWRATLEKPVSVYIEDLGASAAYWLASGAQRITANRAAEIGSLGVFAVLQDLSGLAAREDIRIVVKSTGPYKGLGVPGTPITQELEDEVQSTVNQFGAFFFEAVQRGRGLSDRQLAAVTDGRVWMAGKAQEL